jgi:hypothetical protein
MAFEKNGNTKGADNGIPANKKAVGFINFYLPTTGGSRRKVGAIPCREMYSNERALAEWFAVDPAGRAEIFLKQLQVEYNASTPAEDTAFDLPDA